MTEREEFLVILGALPLLRADAVAVLCGEDGIERTRVGVTAVAQGGAERLLLTGYEGCGEGARTCFAEAIGAGVNPANVTVDERATNTAEQAAWIVAEAATHEWRRVLLAASPYHMPRAFLTVVRALRRSGMDREVQMLPVMADHLPWFGKEGRRGRLERELGKVEQYSADVATYAEGLAYLEYWEGR